MLQRDSDQTTICNTYMYYKVMNSKAPIHWAAFGKHVAFDVGSILPRRVYMQCCWQLVTKK